MMFVVYVDDMIITDNYEKEIVQLNMRLDQNKIEVEDLR
jgi:hypothetical protein